MINLDLYLNIIAIIMNLRKLSSMHNYKYLEIRNANFNSLKCCILGRNADVCI